MFLRHIGGQYSMCHNGYHALAKKRYLRSYDLLGEVCKEL